MAAILPPSPPRCWARANRRCTAGEISFSTGPKAGLDAGRGKADDRDQRIEQLQKDVAERDRFIGEQAIALREKEVQGSD